MKMITQTTVKAMGFTAKMIETLLPEPTLKANPRNRTAPIKLWDEETVKAVMNTPAFKSAFEQTANRRNAATKAVQTKTDALKAEIAQYADGITIVVLDDAELTNRAMQAQEEWYFEKCSELTTYGADAETKARWIVNYIRHNLTRYDAALTMLCNRIGKSEAYTILRNTVLDKIAAVYPKYADECRKQLA